jgi:hypothetical protein
MTHSIVLALSVGLLAGPTPTTQIATNSTSNTVAAAAGTSAAQPETAKAQAPTAEKVYCTKGPITGSRMSKQECKTRSQWAKDGVDIDDLLNNQE